MSATARAWTRAGLVAALVLGADQLSKALVRSGQPVGEEDDVFFLLKVVHVKNRGVAFSAFSGQVGIVIALIALAVGALLVYFARHTTRRGLWVPTGMLLGGAAGNVLDRLAFGSVTDWIKLPHWPAFNVADMAITFGVLALVYVVDDKQEGRARAPHGAA